MSPMFRIGFGYDAHGLVEGRKLILGGVEIASSRGLAGHSDADVLVHRRRVERVGKAHRGSVRTEGATGAESGLCYLGILSD